jgi:hypothetical protein
MYNLCKLQRIGIGILSHATFPRQRNFANADIIKGYDKYVVTLSKFGESLYADNVIGKNQT